MKKQIIIGVGLSSLFFLGGCGGEKLAADKPIKLNVCFKPKDNSCADIAGYKTGLFTLGLEHKDLETSELKSTDISTAFSLDAEDCRNIEISPRLVSEIVDSVSITRFKAQRSTEYCPEGYTFNDKFVFQNTYVDKDTGQNSPGDIIYKEGDIRWLVDAELPTCIKETSRMVKGATGPMFACEPRNGTIWGSLSRYESTPEYGQGYTTCTYTQERDLKQNILLNHEVKGYQVDEESDAINIKVEYDCNQYISDLPQKKIEVFATYYSNSCAEKKKLATIEAANLEEMLSECERMGSKYTDVNNVFAYPQYSIHSQSKVDDGACVDGNDTSSDFISVCTAVAYKVF